MFLLNQTFKLIKLLNSEKGAYSIAAGLALGMVLGLVPANPLISAVLLFFILFFRINLAATLLSWALFGLIAYTLDGLFDRFGYYLLTHAQYQPFFTKLYNMPVVPWSRFNNSIVAGSMAGGLLAFLPALFFFRFLIGRYRSSFLVAFTNSKFAKAVKSTKFYQLYSAYSEKVSNLKGALE